MKSLILLLLAFTIAQSHAWTRASFFGSIMSGSRCLSSVVPLSAQPTESLAFAEIIGGGRIGSLLAQAGNCRLLGRTDRIDSQRIGSPIFIATRNDALDSIVEACPLERRQDLVFLQNGYLDAFLKSKQLSENTQALLYLSVTAKGVAPVDGVTALNPQGLTCSTGRHAQALADRLEGLNLKCLVVSSQDYRPAMFEKLMYVYMCVRCVCIRHQGTFPQPHTTCLPSWISTYMLVGTAKECKSVGQAGADYRGLVEQVITELVQAVSAHEGIAFEVGTIPRLAAYTDVVTDFPCAVKEFEWRNQYFYNLGDDKCPVHNGLLRECADKGFLSFALP